MASSSSNGVAAAAPPPPVDLTHHYSKLAKHRIPNALKGLYKFFQVPGIGNLAGGASHLPGHSAVC